MMIMLSSRHYRVTVTSLAIVLLLAGVDTHAQSRKPAAASSGWQLCKPDILAGAVTHRADAAVQASPLGISADQGVASPSTVSLEGNVQARQGDQDLQASSMRLDRLANRLQAEGEFVYGNPSLALRGKQAQWDLNKGQGLFENTQYYLPGRHAQGEAEQVRVDRLSKQSQLKDATFSTCIRGDEFWQLRTRKLDIDENAGRGVARDTTLAIKGVPVLYVPYLSFPITDQRQSGFLLPSMGASSGNGLDLSIPYYWNIAPNQDMTLVPRILSKRGVLLGAEYRFLHSQDRGTITVEYLPYDREYGAARDAIDIRYQASPLPNLHTDLLYEHVSDNQYLTDLGNNIGLFEPSYLQQYFVANYSGNAWTATGRVQRFQTLNTALFPPLSQPYNRLPQLLFNGAWHRNPYGLDYKLNGELVHFDRDAGVTGTRVDVEPGIRFPLEWAAGFVTPGLSYSYTAYELNNTTPGANSTPSRSAPVFSVDSGLFFDRPVQWQWWGNQANIQTLEPRLFYLYVPYRNQSDIPVFDSAQIDPGYPWLFLENRFVGADRLGDANQLTTALTTRLLNANDGRELLRANIGYVYYFSEPQVTLGTVPSAEVIAPGIIADSVFFLRPDLTLHGALEWQNKSNDIQRGIVDLRYAADNGRIFNFASRYVRDSINELDISFIWPINEHWTSIGRWNYSLLDSLLMDIFAGFEHRECCWALRMVARQRRPSPEADKLQNAIYLELELTGLTNIGSNIEKVLADAILGRDISGTQQTRSYR
jgi:LPS-assembly protein